MKRLKPDLVVIAQGHKEVGFDWAKVCREAAISYVVVLQCNNEFAWVHEQIGEAVASYTVSVRLCFQLPISLSGRCGRRLLAKSVRPQVVHLCSRVGGC